MQTMPKKWTSRDADELYDNMVNNGYTRADARLASAASDMLEVLKALEDRASLRLDVTDPESGQTFYNMVREAIELAEGN